MSEDDLIDTGLSATGNVYRVTPLDRDAGGRGEHPFDSFCEPEEDEEDEQKRKERKARLKYEARLARQAEDHISLSTSALKLVEHDDDPATPASADPSVPAAPSPPPETEPPKPKPERPSDPPTASRENGDHPTPRPPPPHVNIVA